MADLCARCGVLLLEAGEKLEDVQRDIQRMSQFGEEPVSSGKNICDDCRLDGARRDAYEDEENYIRRINHS